MAYGKDEFLEVKKAFFEYNRNQKTGKQLRQDYLKQADKQYAAMKGMFRRLRSQRNNPAAAEIPEEFPDFMSPKKKDFYRMEYIQTQTGYGRQYVQRCLSILQSGKDDLLNRCINGESINSVYKDFQKMNE